MSDGDESWLDDFTEGSTSEEVLERIKRGMSFFTPGATADDIARAIMEQACLPDDER